MRQTDQYEVSHGARDKELQALKHELDVEVNINEFPLDGEFYDEFHDHEDLVYERNAGQLRSQYFCLELLNVRGGEFLHE